MYLMMYWK